MRKTLTVFFISLGILALTAACKGAQPVTDVAPTGQESTATGVSPTQEPIASPFPSAIAVATATPPPPRLLTICLGREPQSLFWYETNSASARSVLAAVYDGPADVHHFELQPVILAEVPSLATGAISFERVQVNAGDWLADANGYLTNLAEGVAYRPAGCTASDCVQQYAGGQPVEMEQMVVRFELLHDLRWADGVPLTADDSVYSYEVAKALFPLGQYAPVDRTASYRAVDDTTLEWRGVPGYRSPYVLANFFSPLPRHAWGAIPADQLPTFEAAFRLPLGWGPYAIDEWVAGDHITLHRNEYYFRASEGYPRFDHLVFRFMDDGREALDALSVGECDLIDPSAAADLDLVDLQRLQAEGRLQLVLRQDTAWEFAFFGISSLDPQRPKLFADRRTRQAVALCLDRQKIVDTLLFDASEVLHSYWPADHPQYNPEVQQYPFDPQAAQELLQAVGWLDADGDAATPRLAQGVAGVPDGTPFTFDYLVSPDAERQAAAEIIKDSLAQCGIQANLQVENPEEYLASGPDGPVFGRQFDMAQLALPLTLDSPCALFTSREIPGPYPAYAKGWGGFNASGYSNPAFDSACDQGRFSLPGAPNDQAGEAEAQRIFADDLPVLPLYTRFQVLVTRPDFCLASTLGDLDNALWNLETFDADAPCIGSSQGTLPY